jgi:hypothetical protein
MRALLFLTLALASLMLATPAQAQGRRLRERLRERAKQKEKADAEADKKPDEKADKKADKKKKQVAVHGGKLVESTGHVFEVVLLESEIRIYATRAGKPAELKGANARIKIGIVRRDVGKRANHQGSSATLRYVKINSKKGRLRGYLGGGHKLGKADRQAIKLEIAISGVPKVKGTVRFEVGGVGTSALVTYACEACNEGAKKPRRFFDPGKCPGCKTKDLAREGGEDGKRQRPGWRNRR